jgi:cob(I)alamin adenosyltransferase
MSEVSSQNVYGGAIGVYWPEGGGRRSFFLRHESESPQEIERAVTEEIRSALANRRPLAQVTWSAVQELVSRRVFTDLREQGSTEVQKYVDEFDKELKSKQEKLEYAEREISRLEAEVRKYQAQNPMQSGLILQTASEQDFYAGELSGVVRDALADAVTRVTKDSRRQHILSSIIEANPSTGEAEATKNRLKVLLRDFRGMDARVRSALQDMGFDITEEGKHYKIIFQGDDRYSFTLPKSGSDYRGGLNAASDINRLLF